jgi:hypothetical protein
MSHTGMVHALREAWRVLRPGGLALDLRPANVHRRVAVVRGGAAELMGVMRESLDDGRAADRAVAQMTRRGVGRPPLQFVRRERLSLDRVMDGVDDFKDWLDDFISRNDDLPPHDWLIERLAGALGEKPRRGSVVVSGPLDLRVLRKPAG